MPLRDNVGFYVNNVGFHVNNLNDPKIVQACVMFYYFWPINSRYLGMLWVFKKSNLFFKTLTIFFLSLTPNFKAILSRIIAYLFSCNFLSWSEFKFYFDFTLVYFL